MANERYVPTPEEIEAECAKIREGWDKLRWSREAPAVPWKVPVIDGWPMPPSTGSE